MEMKLTYITIHTMEPEIMKDFYIKYLGAVVDDARPFDRDGSGRITVWRPPRHTGPYTACLLTEE